MSVDLHVSKPGLGSALVNKMSRPQTLATQVARVVRIIGRKAFL